MSENSVNENTHITNSSFSFSFSPIIFLINGIIFWVLSHIIIEGIKLKNKPVFSVQYHPESNPGPQDSVYLFQEFIDNMKKNAKKKRS